ncbi:MAG TPA: DUF1080 domain-containing protein [Chitinophagaceae bacterium]|nr:DUF1080 domain-containing protein [Chitinophagaceae bacterium]
MKKRLLTVIFLLAGLQGVFAQQAGGWVNLFNGRDLSGWKQLNGKAKYESKNGEIIGTTVAGTPNSFLATERTYGNFILELELKMDSMMNSGIQVRSESQQNYQYGRVHGYQVEVDPSPRGWSGGLYDEARRGWLYPLDYNEPAKKAYKLRQWNRYRIECIGNTIRTWVNGVPCAQVIDDVTPEGFIALQVHSIENAKHAGRTIHWRNIRIQTENLKPSPYDGIFVANFLPNDLSEQEKKNKVKLLWDGKTSQGWHGAYKNTFPESGWDIDHGILSVRSSGGATHSTGGDIITDGQYGAFKLQFEFKITDTANSGVKYFVTVDSAKPGSALGLEYQVLDDDKHPDAHAGEDGNRKQASLYDLIPAKQFEATRKHIGEWNRGMIAVYPDNRVEHWLNGYKVVEYKRGSENFKKLVNKSKYKGYKGFGLSKKGHILLQEHGSTVSFRSIKMQEL